MFEGCLEKIGAECFLIGWARQGHAAVLVANGCRTAGHEAEEVLDRIQRMPHSSAKFLLNLAQIAGVVVQVESKRLGKSNGQANYMPCSVGPSWFLPKTMRERG